MITQVRAPKTGLTVEKVDIIQWHKREKERVDEEEVLLTVETDKVSLDIPSPRSGWLTEIRFEEGESVPVGTVIALIADTPDETADTEA
jgi:pyruvate/2-oxoglutarate dehydrogenase complex dihydrolipoamide acyltransferase (E2) component